MLASQKTKITELFKNALAAVGAPENTKIVLERPKQQSHGDIACTVALQCAKAMKQPPRVIADKLVEELRKETADSEMFSAIEIAGPGFINLKLAPSLKQDVVREILKEGPAYGCSDAHTGESILLEYVSANPTGPLHLGHARQGALGDVLSRMLKSQGWAVTREFYYNDAGNQIHNLAISVQARCYELQNKPFEFPEDGYKGAYVLDIAQDFLAKKPIHTFDGNVVESSGNPDDLENIRAYAVAYLREEQHKDLTALGVAFDNYYLESSLYSDGRVAKAVQAIRNAGKTYEKDGALWFKSTDYGDDKDRVMRKADGSYTYFVPDVAYHLAKFERGFNRALNIQGSDHHGTVARVRAGIQAASGDFEEYRTNAEDQPYYYQYQTYKSQVAQKTFDATTYQAAGYSDTQIKALMEQNQSELESLYYSTMQSISQSITSAQVNVDNLQAQLDSLNTGANDYFIYAPTSGVIHMDSPYKEGMVLSAGSALATVASENDDLEIMAMVTVNDRPLLHVGDPCKIAITGLSEYSYGTLTGTVTSIDSDVTSSNNGSYYKMTIKPDATYVVSRSGDKVDLSNGMSVTARVEYDQVTYFEYAMEALGVLFR